MSSFIKDIENIQNEKNNSAKSNILMAYLFGFAGLLFLLVMYWSPFETQYAGIFPGICFGLMAGSIGAEIRNYKSLKKCKE